MPFQKYINDINKRYATGTAREHIYRPSLQNLLEGVIPGAIASNDPARIECGAPDFILTRRKIDVGYIEAKDIVGDLDKTEKTEQLKRYLESLDNLILTDYLEFRFFINGTKVEVIRIGEIRGKTIKSIPENFDGVIAVFVLLNLLVPGTSVGQNIRGSSTGPTTAKGYSHPDQFIHLKDVKPADNMYP